jgi:hypothetical protein
MFKAHSSWEQPPLLTSAISSSFRDREAARNGHSDPTTPENGLRNSSSGLIEK